MLKHHESTISRAAKAYQQDPNVLAVIVGGSVAKGTARPDSDVDLMLVVPEAEYKHRRHLRDCTLLRYDLHDYEGGYVDIKFVDMAFLQAVAERGSEPARNAFRGAFAAWSRVPHMDNLLAQAAVYPEDERAAKMRSFYSHMLIQLYFISQSGADPFLLHHSADTMVFFAGRLLLAYNRVLFPNVKRLMETVSTLPELPKDYLGVSEALLCVPTRQTAEALVQCLNTFHDWGLDWNQALGQYTEDAELNWLDGRPPLADS